MGFILMFDITSERWGSLKQFKKWRSPTYQNHWFFWFSDFLITAFLWPLSNYHLLTPLSSFLNLQNWLEQLKTHGYTDKPNVVICGNKLDLFDRRVVSQEKAKCEALKYGFPYIETSASTGNCWRLYVIDNHMRWLLTIFNFQCFPIVLDNLKFDLEFWWFVLIFHYFHYFLSGQNVEKAVEILLDLVTSKMQKAIEDSDSPLNRAGASSTKIRLQNLNFEKPSCSC